MKNGEIVLLLLDQLCRLLTKCAKQKKSFFSIPFFMYKAQICVGKGFQRISSETQCQQAFQQKRLLKILFTDFSNFHQNLIIPEV